jgi:chemotaxis protein MotD
MMDISVSTGASPAEAAAGAKSGRQTGKGSDADSNGGFSDVLNKAGSGSDRQQGSGSDTQQTSSADGSGKGAVGESPHRSNPKAVIDVSDKSLLAQAEAEAKALNGDKSGPKTARVDVKSVVKQPDDTALADDAGTLIDELAAGPTKNEKPVKTGKPEAKPTGADDSAVSDVLSLLGQSPLDSAAVAAAAAVLVGQKTADATSVEPKDKSASKMKPKDAVADAASALAATRTSDADAEVPGMPTTETTEGQTFRLSRVESRSVSMEMHLGIEKDAESGGKSKIETVDVLDSRRYIGLATNTNSASVTAAISGDSEWAHAMHASSSLSNAAELSSTGKVVNTLKIQMNPIDLGLVTATLRLQGDALNVDLKVETAAAYRQLKEDHNKMLESLRSQGYAVDSVTISMAPTPSSDTGNQSGAQGDSQRSFAQGEGGEARERQNQSGQRSAGGFDVTGEGDVASTSSGSSGSSSAGGVYL